MPGLEHVSSKTHVKQTKKKVMRGYKGFQVRKFRENSPHRKLYGVRFPAGSVILLSDLPKSSLSAFCWQHQSPQASVVDGVNVNEDLGRATGASLVASDGLVSKYGCRVFWDLFESAGERHAGWSLAQQWGVGRCPHT